MTDCGCVIAARFANEVSGEKVDYIQHCPRHSEANVARLESELETMRMTRLPKLRELCDAAKLVQEAELRAALARLVDAYYAREKGIEAAIDAAKELLR